MGAEQRLAFSTNTNNVLKFFVSSILLYPLLEMLLDALIIKLVTLSVLRRRPVRPRSTKLGSFGPQTVYFGSPRWRTLVLSVAVLHCMLQLAGEFGFGSAQVDVARRGLFLARSGVAHPSLLNATHLARRPVAPVAYLDCFDAAPRIDLALTPYPAHLRNASDAQRLAWCTRARNRSFVRYYKNFKYEFERHCREFFQETVNDYRLLVSGTVAMRPVLLKRRAEEAPLLQACEAHREAKAHVEGFYVGGFWTRGNRHFLMFNPFGMRAMFGLTVYDVPQPRAAVRVVARGRFRNGVRFFAHGEHACIEMRREYRLLCLVTVARDNGPRRESQQLRLMEWNIAGGKIRPKNMTQRYEAASAYEIRPTGIILQLTVTRDVAPDRRTENFRKLAALYDIYLLPNIRRLYSTRTQRWTKPKKSKFFQETAVLIIRVLCYRMTADRVHLDTARVEPALERVGSREVATMNPYALLFYLTPALTIMVLVLANCALAVQIRVCEAAALGSGKKTGHGGSGKKTEHRSSGKRTEHEVGKMVTLAKTATNVDKDRPSGAVDFGSSIALVEDSKGVRLGFVWGSEAHADEDKPPAVFEEYENG